MAKATVLEVSLVIFILRNDGTDGFATFMYVPHDA